MAVYYTRDIGPTESSDAEQIELHPDVDVRGTVVPKGPGKQGGFSGFGLVAAGRDGVLSPLAGLLHADRVEQVVVVGLAADVCVAATARDAHRLGYTVTIPLQASAFVHAHPDGDEAAVADLRAAGITVLST